MGPRDTASRGWPVVAYRITDDLTRWRLDPRHAPPPITFSHVGIWGCLCVPSLTWNPFPHPPADRRALPSTSPRGGQFGLGVSLKFERWVETFVVLSFNRFHPGCMRSNFKRRALIGQLSHFRPIFILRHNLYYIDTKS